MKSVLGLVRSLHGSLVFSRRTEALASAIAPMLGPSWTIFDVGCGDGTIASRIQYRRPDLEIAGFEVSVRPETAIPVRAFDGHRIPAADQSCDAVLLIDVLHHTGDPEELLREARRVARQAIVIKDHRLARPLAALTLRAMDWVGNRPHDVVLPYNYWTEDCWRRTWRQLGLEIVEYRTSIGLYPGISHLLFERGLHFLTRLAPARTVS